MFHGSEFAKKSLTILLLILIFILFTLRQKDTAAELCLEPFQTYTMHFFGESS